jgi:hypothetical protein
MYLQHTYKVRSCNHCCTAKAIIITYFEFVLVTLVIQHAMRKRLADICGLSGSIIFFHIISYKNSNIFEKKKVVERTMYVLIFYATFVRNISH